MEGKCIHQAKPEMSATEATGAQAVNPDPLPDLLRRQLGLGLIVELPGSKDVHLMANGLQVFGEVSEQQRHGRFIRPEIPIHQIYNHDRLIIGAYPTGEPNLATLKPRNLVSPPAAGLIPGLLLPDEVDIPG